MRQNKDLLECGLITGLIQAIVFNPWDRALYLSITCERRFLDRRNFSSPMSGVFQTLFHRACSAGLYFPLEEIFLNEIRKSIKQSEQPHPISFFAAGLLAGAAGGVLLNPLSSIKYQYWGEENKVSFLKTSKRMFRQGGLRPFFVGIKATVSRDVIFGGVFAMLRHIMADYCHKRQWTHQTGEVPFVVNMTSACIATVLSSPMNYVRNVHYSAPPEQPPKRVITILNELYERSTHEYFEICKRDGSNSARNLIYGRIQQFRFLQRRLRIGWGTARVGVGMAFSSKLYSLCSSVFDQEDLLVSFR